MWPLLSRGIRTADGSGWEALYNAATNSHANHSRSLLLPGECVVHDAE